MRLKIGSTAYHLVHRALSTIARWSKPFLRIASNGGWSKPIRIAAIDKVKLVDKAPEILTPEQLFGLLSAAPCDLLPVIAIQAFADLRNAEAMRLDWSEVDQVRGYIPVSAKKAKTARRRLIPIANNLAQYLRPHAGLIGLFWPKGGRVYHKASINCAQKSGCRIGRRTDGFGGLNRRDSPCAAFTILERGDARGVWESIGPLNAHALRHSFASYHLAKHCNASELMLYMGHTSTKRIFEAYRELVLPQAAESYWNILPSQREAIGERRIFTERLFVEISGIAPKTVQIFGQIDQIMVACGYLRHGTGFKACSHRSPINGCRRSGVHLVCGTGPESFTRTASSVKSAARAEASLLFHAS